MGKVLYPTTVFVLIGNDFLRGGLITSVLEADGLAGGESLDMTRDIQQIED